MSSYTVGDLIRHKELQELVAVDPSATVLEAAEVMSTRGIGAVLIRAESGAVEGIFTERDVLKRIVAERRDPAATRVAEVMSRNVRHVAPGTAVEQALQLMVTQRYRHLLVQEDAQVLGLISIRDIMYSFIVPEMAMAPEGRYGHMRSRAEEAVRIMQSVRGGEGQR
jgi:signal-transduction protein with cAMP-binding, CBS, and nucleotidyltransferase domain